MDVLLKVYRTSKFILPQTLNRTCSSKSTSDEVTAPGFTKEGDSGFSKVEGFFISKDDQIFNAIGTTDELSSYIGLAREFARDKEHPYIDKLTRIQMLLIDIVNEITKSQSLTSNKQFSEKHTKEIEEWIHEYGENLPPREKFILPGGGKAASSLHVARNVCQRAERSVLPLVKQGIINHDVLVYFNRLGDFLLTISRFAAKTDMRTESVYTPGSKDKKK